MLLLLDSCSFPARWIEDAWCQILEDDDNNNIILNGKRFEVSRVFPWIRAPITASANCQSPVIAQRWICAMEYRFSRNVGKTFCVQTHNTRHQKSRTHPTIRYPVPTSQLFLSQNQRKEKTQPQVQNTVQPTTDNHGFPKRIRWNIQSFACVRVSKQDSLP